MTKQTEIKPLQPIPKQSVKSIDKPMTKEDFIKIHKRYKLICNNSVYGGDCHGETFCEGNCDHRNLVCKECRMFICGCCYEKQCPCCKKPFL
jgi:hypothetical protein